MLTKQQIYISNTAKDYFSHFGSLSYCASRLIRELGDQIFGLPNLRPVSRNSDEVSKSTILVNTSDNFVINIAKRSRSYTFLSYSRILEYGAATDHCSMNDWPVDPSTRLQDALFALYNLSTDELSLLKQEINKL